MSTFIGGNDLDLRGLHLVLHSPSLVPPYKMGCFSLPRRMMLPLAMTARETRVEVSMEDLGQGERQPWGLENGH